MGADLLLVMAEVAHQAPACPGFSTSPRLPPRPAPPGAHLRQ